jgi:ComEC/Rec2-related protein
VLNAAGDSVVLSGTVEEVSELAFYQATYVIRTEVAGVPTRVRITAPENRYVRVDSRVTAEVTLAEFRDSGVFPERSFNHSKGVLLWGVADEIALCPDWLQRQRGSRSDRARILEYNDRVRNEISAAFPNDYGGLLRAVALGDSSGLSPELRQSVRTSGAAHYTAVSGLHMTMLVHMFMLAFAMTPLAANRKAKFATAVVLIAILAVFFGLSMSVTRAAIMLIIVFGGELFMRKGSTLNSLAIALFAILLFQPYAILDAGLIMSFSGTFGVGVVAPRLMPPAFAGRAGGTRNLKQAFVVSASASLCVLPASAIFFGGFSVLAPLTSVLILPFFTIAVASVMLFAAVGWIPVIGQVCLLAAGIMSRIIVEIVTFLGRFDFAWFGLGYWFTPIWVALAIGAVFAVRLLCKSTAAAVRAACITVATLILMTSVHDFAAIRGYNRDRTYITIYSDSTAAWVRVRQSDTELLIITADTSRAFAAVRETATASNPPTLVVLLESRRNNEELFADLPSQNYISPDCEAAIYDVNGRFVLDVRYTRENEVLLRIGDYTILFTRASNDDASPANVVIASGVVRNKRDFNADRIVYVGRTIPIDFDHEHSAYFEPLYLIL